MRVVPTVRASGVIVTPVQEDKAASAGVMGAIASAGPSNTTAKSSLDEIPLLFFKLCP